MKKLVVLSVVVAVVFACRRWGVDIVGTTGASMWPALPASGTTLWVDRTAAWRKRIDRFELAVFAVDAQRVVKRVVGLAGDCVSIRAGDLWIRTPDGGFARLPRPDDVVAVQRCPIVPGFRMLSVEGPASVTPGGGISWSGAPSVESRIVARRSDGETRLLDDAWLRDGVSSIGTEDVADIRIALRTLKLSDDGRLRIEHALGDDRLVVDVDSGGIVATRTGDGLDPAPVRFPGVPITDLVVDTLDGITSIRLAGVEASRPLWSVPRDTTRGGASRLILTVAGSGSVESVRIDRDVHYRSRGDAAPVVVPSNAVFILGDNPVASTDGRDFGTVSLDVLKGRALRGR